MSVRTRPEALFQLFTPTTSIKGVGPRISDFISKLAGPNIIDLLWHLPTGIIDRRYSPDLTEAKAARVVSLTLRIDKHIPPPVKNKRIPYRVNCSNSSGNVTIVYFHSKEDYLRKSLPIGETRIISGRLELFDGSFQITHPDIISPISDRDKVLKIHPTYSLTEGISQNTIRKVINEALHRLPNLPEWLDSNLLDKCGWPSWSEAILNVHNPATYVELDANSAARQRLAYDELLASQLAIYLMRDRERKRLGKKTLGNGNLRRKLIQILTYKLTACQQSAIEQIIDDMSSETRMLRLLQGDVGSGKTIVSLFAMLNAVETKQQAVLMAPTEILAQQHYETLVPLVEKMGVSIILLTGRNTSTKRKLILEDISSGKTSIIIGTHALFQNDVIFKNLAIAVVDEQHRFGVQQRLLLAEKGKSVDVLLMTATPIPRTLMLAYYGDLDESQLREKPAGRIPIDTRAIPLSRIDEVITAISRKTKDGAKIFWVGPLINESDVLDIGAATDRYNSLKKIFGDRVGLVHGQLKAQEKSKVMERFSQGLNKEKDNSSIDILVATTVIEVGVDIPDATVMVIEHAERFGLAQLHQLRGRIGRNDKHSTCLLMYSDNLGKVAESRISILRKTDDGFRIAEEDLALRGGGDVLGIQQSGLPIFRLASMEYHSDMISMARDDVKLIIEKDKDLSTERGFALRTLLHLFERDLAVKLLRAG